MRGLNKVTWGGDKVRDSGTDTVTYTEIIASLVTAILQEIAKPLKGVKKIT